MDEGVRVTLSTDEDGESVRVHDSEGELQVDDATFRFSVDGDPNGDAPPRSGTEGENEDGTLESTTDDPCYIAPISAVPTDGTLRCLGIDSDRNRSVEFILRRDGDDVYAWRNSCPHQPEVPLDRGNGATVTDRHLVCQEHGARFVLGDGFCSSGPCQGARLPPVEVSVEDDAVYLTDDRFDACRQR